MTVTTLTAASTGCTQSKTISGDSVTITATVEAIDAASRTLTVKDRKGNHVPITVSKAGRAIQRDGSSGRAAARGSTSRPRWSRVPNLRRATDAATRSEILDDVLARVAVRFDPVFVNAQGGVTFRF